MVNSRLLRILLPMLLVLSAIGGILIPQTLADAQTAASSTPTPTQPPLQLDCPYPSLAIYSGSTVSFDVDIKYYGTDTKLFNINTTSISDWNVTTTAADTGKEISAIQIVGNGVDTPAIQSIKINMTPTGQIQPDPGSYKITLKVSSGTLNQSMDLTAVVKDQYAFSLTTDASGSASASPASVVINSGKGSQFSFNVVNSGSGAINNLDFTSTKPDGWNITFNPSTINSLGAGLTQQVNATITAPSTKNVDGDYILTFKANNQTLSTTMDVRVTVVTPGIPTWVVMAIIIVVVVVLALAYRFVFQRRSKVPA